VYAVFSARVIDHKLYLHLFTLLGVTLIDRLIGCFLARLLLQDGAGSITAVQHPKPSTGIRPPFALEPTTIHSTSVVSYRVVSYAPGSSALQLEIYATRHEGNDQPLPSFHPSPTTRLTTTATLGRAKENRQTDRQTDRPTEKEAEKKSGEETKEERRKKRTYEDPSR